MSDDLVRELNEIRKEYGMDVDSFIRLVGYAEHYHKSHPELTDEDIAEIVKEAMNYYDYPRPDEEMKNGDDTVKMSIKYSYMGRKRAKTCFKLALEKLGYEEETLSERRI